MKFNISTLQNFVKCPQYAYIHDHQLIVRDGVSTKLTVGSMFHKGMEARLRDLPAPHKLTLLTSLTHPAVGSLELWDKHQLSYVLDNWKRPETWEVAHVEVSIEAPLEKHTLQGRLDGLVKLDGMWWSVQHKTYEGSLDALTERVRLSWHEVAYQYLAESVGYKPFAGTILNAVCKLPGYQMVADAAGKKSRKEVTPQMRVDACTTHYLARSPSVQNHQLVSICYFADRMDELGFELSEGNSFIPRNHTACWNFGSRCQYYEHCWNGASLNDPRFVKLTPRYGEPDLSALRDES